MEVVQARLPERLVNELDTLVSKGMYANKSEIIRDALRKFLVEKQIGTISNNINSVEEISAIRKKLSKEKIDLNEINSF